MSTWREKGTALLASLAETPNPGVRGVRIGGCLRACPQRPSAHIVRAVCSGDGKALLRTAGLDTAGLVPPGGHL